MPSGTVFNAIAEHIPAGAKSFLYPITVWDMRVTPMSTPQAAIGAAVGYLAAVWAGQKFMQNRPPVPRAYLKWPSVVHNVLLSLGSFLLLYLILEEEVPLARRYGAFGMICNSGMYTPRMVTLYIINYYFKYWEFIDTFFLVIKKKKLMFLHVYHHMATAALCYSQIKYETPVSWVVITMNLAVHVIMYGYYAMATLGIRCPWKKWITTGQILQFIIDLVFCFYAWYNHAVSKLSLNLPSVGPCDGSPLAAGLGVAVLTSYLFLFILCTSPY